MFNTPSFQIIVERDNIIMHGAPQESAGNVLRGKLVLELSEVTKIKSIKLTFQGKSKVVWHGDSLSPFQSEEKIVFQHEWVFLEPKKYHILESGKHYYDFEVILPGSLPETVEGCEQGSIEYKLKAVAERHLALNLNARQKITLQRCTLLNLEDALDTVVSNLWTDKVIYDLSVDSKTFTLDDEISFSIDLTPLNESIRIHEYVTSLSESVSYNIGTKKRASTRAVSTVKGNKLNWNGERWSDLIKIRIPKTKNACLYDTDNSIIQISHQLRLSIVFMVYESRLVELRATLPIIITLKKDDMELPAYREHDPYTFHLHGISDHIENIDFPLPSYNSIITDVPPYKMELTSYPIHVI
ncbi:16136_t:CDS:2 [Cetraspora pellucida]|uniref:16136_t:CDS:1 n=1 Tax=Cetraspora pellucida TaxID=1433469 RepID=A0A9N8ZC85_9GLOM|nr:16136_t:CDS:2 [Cetraspora pellucida]